MEYKFIKGQSDITFVVFHGTGGTMDDLVPIVKMIDQEANILTFEGDVDEMGMKRFFKRLKPGVFDEGDIETRVKALQSRLKNLADQYNIKQSNMIGFGYSNGANILAALMYEQPVQFKALMLNHPMKPYQSKTLVKQAGLPIFMSAGTNDPMCEKHETESFIQDLENAEAHVDVHWHDSGHQLTQSALNAAKAFYQTLKGEG